MIRVDNTIYTWMGDPIGAGTQTVTQKHFWYSSTKSVFSMDIGGKVEMTITFLSPITPGDQKRQSLVFSYLEVTVESQDGNPHDVQLYADISAGKTSPIFCKPQLISTQEWVAGDHSSVAQWDFNTTNNGISYHRVYRQTQLLFSETNDQADWGHWFWATKKVDGVTFQSGADKAVHGAFQRNGKLANTKDTHFRPINKDFPVFGFSIDLGSITSPVSTLFALGLTQEQAILFDGQTGNVPLNSLWKSYFPSETDAVSEPYQVRQR
jgi:hypothetical protein